ncbi:MAG TPA: hypothetical protein VEM14_03285 [Gemmatimonadaceae bacterium]|nr:hypothetical protein [Gemmatimonadaceae bacterium]
MIEFRYLHGAVYIFENAKAQRVKVGMTINTVVDRLGHVNDMWLGRKVTCQVCGGRLVNIGGHVPGHGGWKSCPGGDELPLEKDMALAESHLDNMKRLHGELSGKEKGSLTKKIKTLAKRIGLYRRYQRTGVWQLNTTFYTECAEQVELLSHEILAERLDKEAPFGEVFCCSVSEATEAVETALSQLGLLDSARKELNCESPTDAPQLKRDS